MTSTGQQMMSLINKCSVQPHTHTALDAGSAHWGILHYAHGTETMWTVRTKRSSSRISHKAIYLPVSSQPIDVDFCEMNKNEYSGVRLWKIRFLFSFFCERYNIFLKASDFLGTQGGIFCIFNTMQNESGYLALFFCICLMPAQRNSSQNVGISSLHRSLLFVCIWRN